MGTKPKDRPLSPQSIEALENFSENIDIVRFQKDLRSVVFQYLSIRHDDLIGNFESFIEDLDYLFDFLDIVAGTNAAYG